MSNSEPHIFCCLNGEILSTREVRLSIENRAFRYGDGLFETIRAFGTRVPLLPRHYERLVKGMEALHIKKTSFPVREVLQKKIEQVITKNRFFKSSRIRLTVFRNDGGLYTPTDNHCSYLIEASPIDTDFYQLNDKGLITTLYDEMSKSASIISPYKTASSLLFVLAGIFKAEQGFQEVLIQNEKGKVIESLASNLFWFSGAELYTCSVASGCVDGVMRGIVLEVARDMRTHVVEVDGVDYDQLKLSDEVFITNAIQGLNWVVGIDDKRFYNTRTVELYRQTAQKIREMMGS